MPGIEARAPERTDSSSGSAASPKRLAHLLLDEGHALQHLGLDQLQHGVLALFGEHGAGLGADGEAGRHGDAQAAHLGQVGALAAEQVLHRCGAIGAGSTKHVNALCLS